jgi:hypothetical protein
MRAILSDMINRLQAVGESLMSLGKILKSIFGGGQSGSRVAEALSEPVSYKEFSIEAAPIDEGGKYRTAGYISGEVEGETRRVRFIRADENNDRQAAIDHSLSKARQIIDEQGAKLLEKSQL